MTLRHEFYEKGDGQTAGPDGGSCCAANRGNYRVAAFNLDAITGACARRSVRSATTESSGQRRRARLKSGSLWRDENKSDVIKMLDRLRNKRHRQLRCVRQERRRSQMDDRTNRAVIIRLVGRMLRRSGRDDRGLCVRGCRGGRGYVEMNVAEGEDKLQRHRRKRQPTRTPLPGSNPTHHATLPSHPSQILYSRAALMQ
jgi:hypothetical protein